MANSPEIKLEKKVDAKLDISDKQYLSGLKAEDLQKSFQKLKDEKFDLSAKTKGVKLEDIVKNYNTSTHTIEMNKEKIPVGKGTDLAAWIQVLLVADGRNIKTNQSKINLGIDGSIGDTTGGAIDDYKNAVKETPKPGKEKLPENVLDDSVMREYIVGKNIYNITTNELGKADADSFKNYKITGPNGKFLTAAGLNNKLTINYTSPQSKNFQKIVIDYKNITAQDGGVDGAKLVNSIKSSLLKNEANLTAKAGKESVGDGVEDVQVKSFSGFMQEYIKGQGRQAINGELDFKTGVVNGSGMEVSDGILTVNFPGHGNLSWRLTDMQTNNKFDQNKFVTKLSERMTPRAQTWKGEQLTKAYKDLPKNTSISAMNNPSSIDISINKYNELKTRIDKYAKVGVKVEESIKNDIPFKIENLTNQKNYLTAKNWIEQDVKSFEKRNNEEMSRSEMKVLEKEVQGRVSQLLAGTTYLTTSKVIVKDAFVKNKKAPEYDAYVKRYQAML